MRVLHVSPELFGHGGSIGGAERYALELAKTLATRTPTRLVSFGDEPKQLRDHELEIEVLGRSVYVRGMRQNPISLQLLPHLLWADVIHCHQQRTVASTISALVARMTRRPVFVTDHGGGGWDISSYIGTEGWYDGLLHVSQYSAAVSGQLERRNCRVILGGVDTTRFTPQSGMREQVVLFVGRLAPSKGVNDLIVAMPPTVRLEIIGPAVDRKYLSDLMLLSKGKNVSFNHHCTDEELVSAYNKAACVVLPSVYRQLYGQESLIPELLGQTLLEGMATATPVVCTDVAAMPEVVEHQVTGLIVPPNDPDALRSAIVSILGDPIWASRLGAAGHTRVLDHFSWEQVADRCLQSYRQTYTASVIGRRSVSHRR